MRAGSANRRHTREHTRNRVTYFHGMTLVLAKRREDDSTMYQRGLFILLLLRNRKRDLVTRQREKAACQRSISFCLVSVSSAFSPIEVLHDSKIRQSVSFVFNFPRELGRVQDHKDNLTNELVVSTSATLNFIKSWYFAWTKKESLKFSFLALNCSRRNRNHDSYVRTNTVGCYKELPN